VDDLVKIVECPRDAWQGLAGMIPAEVKAGYLQSLLGAGFRHIDAVSFVSPAAVPQMADSEEVLKLLGASEASGFLDGVEIIGIVVNKKGAERAIATGAVRTLGFPYSISASFLQRNQRQTPEQSLQELHAIHQLAHKARLNVVAYLSMAFGNPYGDAWSLPIVLKACESLRAMGIRHVSLADTVGVATPLQLMETVGEAVAEHADMEIGVHLHSRPDDAVDRIKAAYAGGCRRFDAAMGGLGGCPFAQDELVGNIPTELLIGVLKGLGVRVLEVEPLNHLLRANEEIAMKYGGRAH
jgi:hydroxymethylglutaryl-CoA lyase